jgi:hypothetical protein
VFDIVLLNFFSVAVLSFSIVTALIQILFDTLQQRLRQRAPFLLL